MFEKTIRNSLAVFVAGWMLFLGEFAQNDSLWVYALICAISGVMAGAIGMNFHWLLALLPGLPIASIGLFGAALASDDHPELALSIYVPIAITLAVPALFAEIVGRGLPVLLKIDTSR